MAAKVIQDEHMKDEAALRKDKRALKVELKELELSHEEIVKNLQIEHDKLVTKLREDYERTAKVPPYPTPHYHASPYITYPLCATECCLAWCSSVLTD